MTDNMEEANQTEQNIERIKEVVQEIQGYISPQEERQLKELGEIIDNAEAYDE